MGRCETENLTDSAYFQIVDGMKKKSSPELKKIYDRLNKQQKQTEKPKTSWLKFFLFWR